MTGFEVHPTVELAVEMADESLHPLTSSVTDINDLNEAPTVAAQSFGLAENCAAGTILGAVQAGDRDAGRA